MSREEKYIDEALSLLNASTDSNYRVAKNTGISESTIGNYMRGKTKPTLANATLLIQYFGGTISKPVSNARSVDNVEFMQIPLVPISARAGYLCGFGDNEYVNDLPTMPVIVDRHYKGKYMVFEVEGDSMDDGSRDAICDKDKVLCREVQRHLWTSKLHYKDWYFVIVHKTEGVIIKQIVGHDVEQGEIYCHSRNPMFTDFTLHLNDVLELYNVIKIVDRNTRI